MSEKALGLIETRGLVPAIEAADVSLKTADVSLDGLINVGAGLVTITLRGDVSSVKASVEAGADAARKLGAVISTTVIGRTAEGLDRITDPKFCQGEKGKNQAEPVLKSPVDPTKETMPGREQLSLMSVVELRSFVRSLDGYPMSREEIRSARKNDLVENILNYYLERGVDHG